MIELEKQPSENKPLAIEFKGKLPSGLSLLSGTVSAVRLDTAAVDNSILSTTVLTISGTQAIFRYLGGVSGVDYKITALVTLSDTVTILEEDFLLHVVSR